MKRKQSTNTGAGTSTANRNAPEIGNEIGVISSNSFLFCLFMNLPTALLCNILFKLPIKSLMIVRLVCKAFDNIISSPDFTLNYSKNSPFTTFLSPSNRYNCSDTLDLIQVSVEPWTTIRTSFKVNIPTGCRFFLDATCNGLVCLSVRERCRTDRIYICNPILGECISIPAPKIKGERVVGAKYGLGFCRSSNKYKLLRRVHKSGNINLGPADGNMDIGIDINNLESEGEILTIGIDRKWRYLADTRFPLSHYSDPIPLNGVFHCVVNYGIYSTYISTFDLKEEKIGRLSHPLGLSLCGFHISLISRNNQLSLVDNSIATEIVMWTMKQYGLEESWTKVMRLDISFIPVQLHVSPLPKIIILQNGDILFCSTWGEYLSLCDPRKREVKETEFRWDGGWDYAPSFVSLNTVVTGASLLKPRPRRKAAEQSRYGRRGY